MMSHNFIHLLDIVLYSSQIDFLYQLINSLKFISHVHRYSISSVCLMFDSGLSYLSLLNGISLNSFILFLISLYLLFLFIYLHSLMHSSFSLILLFFYGGHLFYCLIFSWMINYHFHFLSIINLSTIYYWFAMFEQWMIERMNSMIASIHLN